MCLYGYPKGNWEVALPAEEVPPELPEPALGINFARDGMEHRDWVSLIAVHSDSWLYAVAFYYCARFNKQERSVILFLNVVIHMLKCLCGYNQKWEARSGVCACAPLGFVDLWSTMILGSMLLLSTTVRVSTKRKGLVFCF